MAKWYVSAKKADFQKMAAQYQIDPVLARILRNRDIEEAKISGFLNPDREALYSPFLMKDLEKGISIIKRKIKEEKAIRIIGDYDIDGICSTYILKKGLHFLGAKADAVIPHRMKDGYGLNESLIQEAYDEGIDTIITCDNGITAYEQIQFAKRLGMTVVITDHHEVPYEEQNGEKKFLIPEADAVIDPKREDCDYPFSGICGGVVAYKFVQAFLQGERESGEIEEILEELLELAAFATVGDVMELRDENRIIVKYGLEALQHTKNIGIQALMEVNGIEGKKLTPYHIGFVLGPCLNAAGRLDSAERALQLLEAQERKEAVLIARDLKEMNDSRKEMTQKGVEEAVKEVEENGRYRDKVLVIYLPDCHESLAGIIAGRIREKYGKPTFVLTKGEEHVKGSGRSIEAFHLFEEMSKYKDLFIQYGGHKLAAGLSIKEENMEKFRKGINETCQLTEEDFEEKIHIDVPMPISYLSKALIEQLEVLAPFGAGNPKPVFAQKNVCFLKENIFGKNKNVAKFVIRDETETTMNAIFFGDIAKFHLYLEEKYGKEALEQLTCGKSEGIYLSIVYYPTINEFRGTAEIQVVLEDYQ